MTRISLGLVLAGLLVAGCGGDDGPGPGGGSGDSGTGGGRDSGPMPRIDSGPMPGVDSGPTPGVDSGPTPGVDAGMMMSGDGQVGDACTTAADCGSSPTGAMCMTNYMSFLMFPGGYCTAPCMGMGTCGAGAECFSFSFPGGGGMGQCLKTCTSDADCRTGEMYSCRSFDFGGGGGGTMYCLPMMGGGIPGFGDGGIPGFGDGGLPGFP